MYKILWQHLNRCNIKEDAKVTLFLFCSVTLFSLIGALAWLALGRLVLPGLVWLACFVGYPGCFAGYLGGILFLWKQEE